MFFINDLEYLSNFYHPKNGVKFEGTIFPTSEHAYQAGKATNPEDFDLILKAPTPGKSKKIANSKKIRSNFHTEKVDLMYKILLAKFNQNGDIKMKLKNLDVEIVEHNYHHDNFWGDCVCLACSGKEKLNHLGLLLMKVREEFQNE